MGVRPILVAAVGFDRVIAARFRRIGGGLALEDVAIEPVTGHEETARNDQEKTAGWADAFRRLGARPGFRGEFRLALPPSLTLTRFLNIPAVPVGKRPLVAAFEVAQSVPLPLETMTWDFAVVAEGGPDHEIAVAAAKRTLTEGLSTAVAAAGSRVGNIVPPGTICWAAFRYNYEHERAPVLFVTLSAASTQILLITDTRFTCRSLTFGTGKLAETLAALGPDPAETAARRSVAVQRFRERLHSELRRSIPGLLRENIPAPTAVYLSGAEAIDPALVAWLGGKMSLPVHRFEPLRRVTLSPARAEGATCEPEDWTDVVGLAAGTLPDFDGPSLDLLPAARRDARVFSRRQPWWIAAAVLIAVSFLPPLWYCHRVAARAERRTAEIERELQPLRSIEARNQQNLQAIEQMKREAVALRQVLAGRTQWLQFLAGLQEALAATEDVWLDRMSLDVRPVEVVNPDPGYGTRPAFLTVGGRLLESDPARTPEGETSLARVQRLIANLRESGVVTAVETERFDDRQPGFLQFELRLAPRWAASP